MESKNTNNSVYFQHLDVLRFFAAIMIIVFHGIEAWTGWFKQEEVAAAKSEGEAYHFIGKYGDQFVANLGIGVDIFFLISGFLITYLLLEEKKRFGKIHIGKFMLRRTLRIWPLFFLLIIAAPFIVRWMDVPTPNYLANALFLGNFEAIRVEQWTYPFAHFWSICIEEHFYLVWPFIILLIPRNRLLLTFFLLIGVSIGFRIYSFQTLDHHWLTIYLHTISKMDVLILGAIGALFYSKSPIHFKLNRWLRYLLLILAVVWMSTVQIHDWNNWYEAGFKKFIMLGFLAILLLDFNFNPKFNHLLPPKSIFHYLGKVSYGIYMYGNILIMIVIKQFMWRFELSQFWIYMTVLLLSSILIPIASYELYEKHFLKIARRFRLVKTER